MSSCIDLTIACSEEPCLFCGDVILAHPHHVIPRLQCWIFKLHPHPIPSAVSAEGCLRRWAVWKKIQWQRRHWRNLLCDIFHQLLHLRGVWINSNSPGVEECSLWDIGDGDAGVVRNGGSGGWPDGEADAGQQGGEIDGHEELLENTI